MSGVETTRTVTDGDQSSNEQTVVAYEYDSAGNRVASTTSTSVDGGPATTVRREFLTEQQNHTGYSQVLQETEFDAAGNPTEKIVYTIGHDQISQTRYLASGTSWGEGSIAYFGTDGHGSVRVLYDAAATIVQAAGIPQIYHFDAYGNLLSVGGQSLTTQVSPLTTYLYSGEAFDFTIGQQYLRARWYDPTTGRFNRLDPFFGNQSDPQSFHKYAYVHGDPVNGVDPAGMFLGLAFGVGLQMMLPGPGDFIIGGLQALVQAYAVNLQWDVEWAQDLSLPDSWGSRLDNSWVYAALGAGFHDAFWTGIPFTSIGFNPLDLLGVGGGADELGMSYEEFYGNVNLDNGSSFTASAAGIRPNRLSVAGGIRAKFSGIRQEKINGTLYNIGIYKHTSLPNKRPVVLFPENAKPVQLKSPIKIKGYATPPRGKKWENLGDDEIRDMRDHDFKEFGKELKSRGIKFRRKDGVVTIDGIKYTIHHHHRKGYFELIRQDVHERIGHVGMAQWHS